MFSSPKLLKLGLGLWFAGCLLPQATAADTSAADDEFGREMVEFMPYPDNPVFAGTGKDTWDRNIRERGYVLKAPGGLALFAERQMTVAADQDLAACRLVIQYTGRPANRMPNAIAAITGL